MKTTLYHEVDPTDIEKILREGIKREPNGEKSDAEKEKVDTFLDTHLPDWTKGLGLTRSGVTYMYLADDGNVIDITNGQSVAVEDFKKKSDQTLLRVTVDAEHCFVSDLDLYDTLVRAMELDEQDSTREHLADRYWERVTPFEDYEPGSIKRPEVMVNTDIAPQDIEVVKT